MEGGTDTGKEIEGGKGMCKRVRRTGDGGTEGWRRGGRKNLTIVIQQNIVWFHVSVKDGSIYMYTTYEHHLPQEHTPVCYSRFMQMSQSTGNLGCIKHAPLLTESRLPNIVYMEP